MKLIADASYINL